MSDILLPTWIKPQAESTELIDDSTSVFRAAYAPGVAQRVSYVEPRLQVKQSFKALRGNERAAMLAFLNRAKGKFVTIRAAVGYALRGSFPTTELLANNDFASGISGYTVDAPFSAAMSDRVFRATRVASGNAYMAYQLAPYTQYAPHVARAFAVSSNPNEALSSFVRNGNIATNMSDGYAGYAASDYVPINASGSDANGGVHTTTANGVAGDFIDIFWESFARCGYIDNACNSHQFSDQLDNAVWTKTRCSVTANSTTAPDGSSTADSIIEDSSVTVSHFLQTSATTKVAAAQDWCMCGHFKANTRSQVFLQVAQAGTNFASVGVNLTDGSLAGSVSAVGTVTNARAFIVNMGNGWWFIALIANVPAAITTTNVGLALLASGGSTGYTGNGTSGIFAWRVGYAQTSVPGLIGQTTTGTVGGGTNQTGSSLNVKGLPVSTAGLLLAGDQVQIGGELKLLTHSLDSDAAGRGILKFAPAICSSPADSDPVIIASPLGRFILADNPQWTNNYGVYADLDITLEAINE